MNHLMLRCLDCKVAFGFKGVDAGHAAPLMLQDHKAFNAYVLSAGGLGALRRMNLFFTEHTGHAIEAWAVDDAGKSVPMPAQKKEATS